MTLPKDALVAGPPSPQENCWEQPPPLPANVLIMPSGVTLRILEFPESTI
jgi:hypothetical protein